MVIYNAEFDCAMLCGDCERHQLPALDMEVTCAMVAYSQYVGHWSDYWGSYRYQPLPGWSHVSPGAEHLGRHVAVEDCRAVLALLRRMADTPTQAVDPP